MVLNAHIPAGPIQDKWDRHRFELRLVNPANKRKYTILVVGSGLAGASAAATLSELGYNVKCFCFQDSPRRAHSIAAQGGINAAKNYPNDGDSIWRLFYDTVKGGDFRAREANVYRLAQISVNIIDQCVAQGVPFAREYGGLLANRSFGGAQVSRTFYARGQTGQQLLLGAYQALEKEIAKGGVTMFPRTEMLDLIVIGGQARGIVVRDMVTGKISSHLADAVVLGTGGYGNVFYLSTNAKGSNATAIWRAHKRGRAVRQSVLHPDPSDLHSGERRVPVQAHADERVAPERRPGLGAEEAGRSPPAERDSRGRARLLPRAEVPELRQSRAAGHRVPRGQGSVRRGSRRRTRAGSACTSTSPTPSERLGEDKIRERYGNLFEMYHAHHRREPVPAPDADLSRRPLHDGRALGGLQPDEHRAGTVRDRRGQLLRSRRQPAGRERADAGPGGRLLHPPLYHRRLSRERPARSRGRSAPRGKGRRERPSTTGSARFSASRASARSIRSTASWASCMWDKCGMARRAEGLRDAIQRIPVLREEFWHNVNVPGSDVELNQALEKAGRVADFLELGELMCRDALHREESCGGHFREEYQTHDGEARRDDEHFAYVAAWEWRGEGQEPRLHKEPLVFENVKLATRSYK